MSTHLHSRVLDRYVDALLSVSRDPKTIGLWRDGADALSGALTLSPALSGALSNPLIAAAAKERVVVDVASKLSIDTTFTRTMRLMIRNGRGGLVGAFAERFIERAKPLMGVFDASVTSATPLSAAQTKSLQSALGPGAAITATVDPALIGGMIVRMGSWRMDDSIQGKLDRLARSLTKAA